MFTTLTDAQLLTKKHFIENYVASPNAADGSAFDANANVSQKNISTLSAEIHKDINIQINRKFITEKLKVLFDDDIAFEYNKQIKKHLIYCHDESSLLQPYCCAISLHPYIYNGFKDLGGESKPPKHLDSFCGGFVNLMFAVSSQVAGAVAASELFLFIDYFARKDFGEKYLDEKKAFIRDKFEQIIYCINLPAAARGFQSVFFNVSIFDSNFINGIFAHFKYPDGSSINLESLMKLQIFFLSWLRKERERAILTFPVVTVAILLKDNKPEDVRFADIIAEEMALGNSFFLYQSASVDSLSSCCFEKSQMTLTRSSNGVNYMSFEELYNTKYNDHKRNFTIFHNGSWCDGKIVKIPRNGKKLFKITTINNKQIIVTEDHLHPTAIGDKMTIALSTTDYLMFSKIPLEAIPEQNLKLSQAVGTLIGAYLGDGSMSKNNINEEISVSFSFNEWKYNTLLPSFQMALRHLKIDDKIILGTQYNNVYPVRINSRKLVAAIRYWVSGSYAHEKTLNMNCLQQSSKFRRGILDGYYATDGGNSNRIYTSSYDLVEQLETLLTSLGMQSIIDTTDRTTEPVIIRGQEFNRNYPLHCIRFYSNTLRRSAKDVFKIINNSIFFKIKSIEEFNSDDEYVYCFEMENSEEPYFTLPNGIITHNCRLKSIINENTFSHTLGNVGIMTGSIRVITLNMNRYIQKLFLKHVGSKHEFISYLKKELKHEIETIHKFHHAHRELLLDLQKKNLLPIYDAGFIRMEKQYSTIGINGLVEAAEFLGINPDHNQDYINFVGEILKVIYDTNKEGWKKYGFMINTEFVPAENLGVKNAQWDKKDKFFSPRDCYNSYFYPVENEKINILEKMILHGKEIIQYLDGGSALHLNLEEHLTKDQYLQLFNIAGKVGCNYWCVNVLTTICNDCGHITKKKTLKCSSCSSPNIDYATRIIGYLKRISCYSKERRKEAAKRFYHKEVANEIS